MTTERHHDPAQPATAVAEGAGEMPYLDAYAAARGLDPAELAPYLPHWVGKTRAQLDADAEALADDPAILAAMVAELDQLEAEFAGADAETAAQIDEEDGPYPYTEAELAELEAVRRERRRGRQP